MAEAFLFYVAQKILQKLASPAFQEIALFIGVPDELNKLKDTITVIRDVLVDAEEEYERSEPNHQIRGWLRKLKDAVYDVDDLLDEFCTETLRRKAMACNDFAKEVRLFFSGSNQLAFRLMMGHKIKNIRQRLDKIADDRNKFYLEVKKVEIEVIARKDQTHSKVCLERVVGREDDKKAVIDLVLNSNVDQKLLIIPIVGMGGLGKTTLAQLVYNDESFTRNYELKLWVCVSESFDVKAIVRKIIESATRKTPDPNSEMNTLVESLYEVINGKKYLLVLDDMWNDNRALWVGLEDLLKGGAKGSTVIVTTRSTDVAKIVSSLSPYFLKPLLENQSLDLFNQAAFGNGQDPKSQDLVEVGNEIVEKCMGVPLVINTIGCLLYGKPRDEWESLKNRKFSEITQQENSILPILKLSYDNLPPHLKQCFAYCSLFPKDYEFVVKELVYLWIAQGLINKPSNCSRSLEQIGHQCFSLLIGRSFFQELKEDELGNVVSCKMHDLMHYLAIKVAGMESMMISSGKEVVHANTRHVSILHGGRVQLDRVKTKKIRTLIGGKSSSSIVSKFKRLRMLDLSYPWDRTQTARVFKAIKYTSKGLEFLRLSLELGGAPPPSIRKLKHLRYINLSCNREIEMLPKSIVRLQNLLVLQLSDCTSLRELPEDIEQLVSLMYLDIENCTSLTHMPPGIGQLMSLEKLSTFVLSKDDSTCNHCGRLDELNNLNNLSGQLRLFCLNHVKNGVLEYKAANLEGKVHLRSLEFHWDRSAEAISMEDLQPHKNLESLGVFNYPGEILPSWVSSLSSLVNLKLINCHKVKHLPPLDVLSSLRYLSICELSKLEYIEYDGSNRTAFFPSLEKLKIAKCDRLEGWRTPSKKTATTTNLELPPFACLSKLEIEDCDFLSLMPPFPSIEGDLKLCMSGKPLQATMMMKPEPVSTSTSTSASLSLPLSKLKSLWLCAMYDLDNLPHEGMQSLNSLHTLGIESCQNLLTLDGGGFSGLTCLHCLQIRYCSKLKSIPGVFQYCTALRNLAIEDCEELDVSDGMQCQHLRSLSSLQICGLPKLASLPQGLQRVATLRSLRIFRCPNLKTLSPIFEHLRSLQQLEIWKCDELESLTSLDTWGKFCGLKRLNSLTIRECSMLKSISGVLQFCTALKELIIEGCYELDFSDGMHNQHLQNLSSLKISFLRELTHLPGGLQHVTTLRILEIKDCSRLRTVSPVLEQLTGLEELQIKHLTGLDLADAGTGIFQDSYSLRNLQLVRLPKLVSLPDWFRHFTSLQVLQICVCRNLASLPEWIHNLISLQRLHIESCRNLSSLPEGICRLTSLQELFIRYCPELSERCKNNTGADWHKIAHIPKIYIG